MWPKTSQNAPTGRFTHLASILRPGETCTTPSTAFFWGGGTGGGNPKLTAESPMGQKIAHEKFADG